MDPTKLNSLGGMLSGKFPIDLDKTNTEDKINYLLILTYGLSGDLHRLKEDVAAIKQESDTMRREGQNSRILSLVAIILSVIACAGVVALFLYLLLGAS